MYTALAHTGGGLSAFTILGICANAVIACLALALVPWRGTGRHRAIGSAPAPVDAPATAASVDDDIVQIPRIPVAKLLDPDTETTLTTALPRQRTGALQPEGSGR
ncbi:hypothetical protein ABZT17_26860 [Streptomyces sp. NPDC005648]|uniref:hypothetical protein n=1 Tax=Streptomyces sp. NPDC005648 TaxID=3157044 RepID=UPI0033BD1369